MTNTFKKMSLVAVLFLTGCVSPPSASDVANADYGPWPADYEQVIKSYLGDTLKDPASAQYRSFSYPLKYYIGTRFGAARYGFLSCVTYNAKNSYGAYTGFQTDGFLIRNGIVEQYLPHGQWFGQQAC
ncbi:hypothetical protein [Achromobacter aloeverae]